MLPASQRLGGPYNVCAFCRLRLPHGRRRKLHSTTDRNVRPSPCRPDNAAQSVIVNTRYFQTTSIKADGDSLPSMTKPYTPPPPLTRRKPSGKQELPKPDKPMVTSLEREIMMQRRAEIHSILRSLGVPEQPPPTAPLAQRKRMGYTLSDIGNGILPPKSKWALNRPPSNPASETEGERVLAQKLKEPRPGYVAPKDILRRNDSRITFPGQQGHYVGRPPPYIRPSNQYNFSEGQEDTIADFETRRRLSRQDTKKKNRLSQYMTAEEIQAEEAWTLQQQVTVHEARKLKRRKNKDLGSAPKPIVLPPHVSVSRLATLLKLPMDLVKAEMARQDFKITNHNHLLTGDEAGVIAMSFNFEPSVAEPEVGETSTPSASTLDIFRLPLPSAEELQDLPPRPPVVTIMGHVDHGKTTLLDFLRSSSIAASEHGGITQHIGAFSVQMPQDPSRVITFLDTPGHSAFLSMRARGANVTDIVILVVAADDSVKPQTIEAIKHAKEANVPIVVAISKADKPGADIERVKVDLGRNGIEVESFGGDVQAIPVSGKTGLGMDELQEAVLTLSEILDHRAAMDGPVEGWILESTTKARGRVATVLVRRGTLRPGKILVAGNTWTRTRTIFNEDGEEVSQAQPGYSVEVDGWKDTVDAGAEVLESTPELGGESTARRIVEARLEREDRQKLNLDIDALNEKSQAQRARDAADDVAIKEAGVRTARAMRALKIMRSEAAARNGAQSTGRVEIPLIVKADVDGSVEAVVEAISVLGNSEVAPNILYSGVGTVSESDVDIAIASGATIVSFNQPSPSGGIAGNIAAENVPFVSNSVIYRLISEVTAVLEERLPPIITTRVLGECEVAQTFSYTLSGKPVHVAGCKVRNGRINRKDNVKVLRGAKREVIFEGTLVGLKNVKKDVSEMTKGGECGVSFEDNWSGAQVGDVVQCVEIKTEKRKLSDPPSTAS